MASFFLPFPPPCDGGGVPSVDALIADAESLLLARYVRPSATISRACIELALGIRCRAEGVWPKRARNGLDVGWMPSKRARRVPTIKPRPKVEETVEPETADVPEWKPSPPVLGGNKIDGVLVCEPLRPHERAVLQVLHRDGQMSISTLWRRCKTPNAWKQETLYDLHRMGWGENQRRCLWAPECRPD